MGLTAPLIASPARADHETDPCAITIEFNSTQVAQVFDVAAEDITSLTVFYFDDNGIAKKEEGIDPTTTADYGPLRVRYDSAEDKTTVQIGGRNAAIRRIVAFGPDCRSEKTSPLDEAAGENDTPGADFTWTPETAVTGDPVTFTSTATDPDGDLIHHGWDFDTDGTEDATGEEVTYTFTTAGDHEVTHTVIDDFDATDSITKTVPVESPQQAKLLADDGQPGDFFGWSVAVDGDTAVVGAYLEDEKGDAAGAAYVFA